MATTADKDAIARTGRGFMSDQIFFLRFALFLGVFILFGFAQFTARGFASPLSAPPMVHLHGGLMFGWVGLFIVQNLLVHRGQLAIHRKLGWTSVALVPVIVFTGIFVAVEAVRLNRVPPFFTDAYLLALTGISVLTFAAVVGWAIAVRKQVQWHRRAMLGAMIVLSEPALGRLLPLPLMNGWGQWGTLVCQLLMVAVLAHHDRKVLAAVHPATRVVAVTILVSHIIFEALAVYPPFVAFAQGIAAG